MKLRFHPLTPDRFPDLVRLFGARGACGGCWCMWPRKTASEFREGRGALNKRALRRLVGSGTVPGILAYVDKEPVGWCALGPREEYVRLAGSRVLRPVDDRPVWSVVCFFVARPWRRKGLTVRLLKEAIRHARDSGARILEGYPVDTRGRRSAAPFVWTGLSSAFRAAGFREATRRSPSRPIFRRALRPRAVEGGQSAVAPVPRDRSFR